MPRSIPPSRPKFLLGEQVRVRLSVVDPDYPDLTIGGWAGEVVEVQPETPATYLIRWNEATLRQIPSIHRKRSERDGFEIDEMWLGEEDLEPDTGEPVNVEQPKAIVTKPLSDDVQEDRIRKVFGLTSDDPLPDVDEETLAIYGAYLREKLRLPLHATWSPASGPVEQCEIEILDISDPDVGVGIDDLRGLMANARLEGQITDVPLAECEAKASNPHRRLLEDYTFWFWNY